jgi:soluble lytic murein transglycosylase-like protein
MRPNLAAVFGVGAVFVVAFGLAGILDRSDGVTEQPVVAPAPIVVPLLQHAERSIDAAAPKIAPGRRALLARLVAATAEETFSSREHQEYWIALLGVESGFNSAARSPVGAVGLGQLMPQYAADFGKACGLEGITAADAADDYTNVHLSACHFRDLIAQQDGSIPLALVAYNAGANSPSIKRARNGGAPAEEPSAYVTKVWISKDTQTKK